MHVVIKNPHEKPQLTQNQSQNPRISESRIPTGSVPRESGYHMPAEWAPHRGTWLSWPHKEASWPGKFAPVPGIFAEFVRHLARREQVHINVAGPEVEA